MTINIYTTQQKVATVACTSSIFHRLESQIRILFALVVDVMATISRIKPPSESFIIVQIMEFKQESILRYRSLGL